MGLSRTTGSLSLEPSTQTLYQQERLRAHDHNKFFPIISTPLIIGDKEYTQQIEIKNTFTNRTALDPNRFTDIHKLLLAYPSAFTVQVTLFNKYNKTNTATYPSNTPTGIHPVHTEYTQINNYELKLLNGFDFNYDQDNNRSDFTCEAIVYPGFIPKIDDFFIMDLKDGNLGLLRINNVVRLSMRQASYHKIECYLFSYMNDELWQNIQKSVTNRVIFNKEAYFNDSIVLLQYDSYTALQQAYETKTDIILNYFKMYYDLTLETIVKKNYQYDPYIVEFLQRHISITESKKRPFQHVHPLPTYEQSIWSVLENKNYKNLSDCLCKVQIEKYRPSAFHVGMNALYDKSYILLSNTGTANYIFSEDFYKNTLTAISDFDIENILIKLLVQNEININSTLNLITDFRNLDDELKFYHLPLYLYLLNNIINRLLKGEQP